MRRRLRSCAMREPAVWRRMAHDGESKVSLAPEQKKGRSVAATALRAVIL
jgi:hypothetical protein